MRLESSPPTGFGSRVPEVRRSPTTKTTRHPTPLAALQPPAAQQSWASTRRRGPAPARPARLPDTRDHSQSARQRTCPGQRPLGRAGARALLARDPGNAAAAPEGRPRPHCVRPRASEETSWRSLPELPPPECKNFCPFTHTRWICADLPLRGGMESCQSWKRGAGGRGYPRHLSMPSSSNHARVF